MKIGYYKEKGDVKWFLPNTKKPFAYSTKSTSDLIEILSETNETTKDVYNAINYDDEAKNILKHFIDKGYGNYIFRDFLTSSMTYRKVENGTIESIDFKDLKKHLETNDYDYDY